MKVTDMAPIRICVDELATPHGADVNVWMVTESGDFGYDLCTQHAIDAIEKWFTEVPEQWASMTIRQLPSRP